jgi:hypothetical protein
MVFYSFTIVEAQKRMLLIVFDYGGVRDSYARRHIRFF